MQKSGKYYAAGGYKKIAKVMGKRGMAIMLVVILFFICFYGKYFWGYLFLRECQ